MAMVSAGSCRSSTNTFRQNVIDYGLPPGLVPKEDADRLMHAMRNSQPLGRVDMHRGKRVYKMNSLMRREKDPAPLLPDRQDNETNPRTPGDLSGLAGSTSGPKAASEEENEGTPSAPHWARALLDILDMREKESAGSLLGKDATLVEQPEEDRPPSSYRIQSKSAPSSRTRQQFRFAVGSRAFRVKTISLNDTAEDELFAHGPGRGHYVGSPRLGEEQKQLDVQHQGDDTTPVTLHGQTRRHTLAWRSKVNEDTRDETASRSSWSASTRTAGSSSIWAASSSKRSSVITSRGQDRLHLQASDTLGHGAASGSQHSPSESPVWVRRICPLTRRISWVREYRDERGDMGNVNATLCENPSDDEDTETSMSSEQCSRVSFQQFAPTPEDMSDDELIPSAPPASMPHHVSPTLDDVTYANSFTPLEGWVCVPSKGTQASGSSEDIFWLPAECWQRQQEQELSRPKL
eukprot:TRINITY_DN76232_c0_g1_i1.p1 TRINITY_DN76232_c0_g1~~TRINITY_DN76232_c0_g1_i1.p1  ORF type:complete len:472 (-),score=33.59 TRINITY_DN76232_c0_g1_i1:96-1484(-)